MHPLTRNFSEIPTIYDYVKRGILPKPRQIGGLSRCLWTDIEDQCGLLNSEEDGNEEVLAIPSAQERVAEYSRKRGVRSAKATK